MGVEEWGEAMGSSSMSGTDLCSRWVFPEGCSLLWVCLLLTVYAQPKDAASVSGGSAPGVGIHPPLPTGN